LQAALQIGHWIGSQLFELQSPICSGRPIGLGVWPARSLRFDAARRHLVTAILQAPELDCWPVQPDDSLAHDADRLNPVP
jgi:hypothetical protein